MKNSKKKEKLKNLLHDAIFVLFVVVLDWADFYSKLFNPVMDSISSLIEFICNNPLCICIIIIIPALTVVLYWYDILKNVKDANFNKMDSFTVNLCIVTATLIAWFMCIQELDYKINACILAASILATIAIVRAIIRSKYKRILSRSDVITLVDLYEGRISSGSKFILIEDSESEEDIYGRDAVIEKVRNVMENGDSSFTVSLVGPWGSGKSTILKCAKKKLFREDKKEKTPIIIDDFEPWLYDDSETMAKEFSTLLFSKLGYRFSSRRIRDFAKQFLGTVSEIEPFGLLKYLPIKENEANPTEIINDYLTGHNKKLIIIIDNLERCKTELIIDFLKMIKRGLNFKNALYILSYDSEIMNEILGNNRINKRYLEKFSQMTIEVPKIDDQKNKEVTTQCFENYLKQLEESPDEYRELVDHITKYITTPRQLLLAINSVYAGKNEYVNPIDSIVLNILKREAQSLYDLIEQNGDKFVHNESIMYADMMNSDNDRKTIEQYCKAERDFFANELRDNESLRNEVASHYVLIEYIFPNTAFFLDNALEYHDLLEQTISSNEKEKISKARKERRLRIFNFFPVYFTGVKNDYAEAADIVSAFIEKQTKGAYTGFLNELSNQKAIIQRYVLQQINEHINELKIKTINGLASSMIGSFSKFSGSVESWSLLSKLIQKVDKVTFERIRKTLMHEYKNFELIYQLDCFMDNKHETGRHEVIKNDFEKMKNTIIQKRINLYEPKYYHQYSVARYLGEKEVIIKYLQSIKAKTPKKKQILILADYIHPGHGRTSKNYTYTIDYSILNEVYSKNEILDIVKKSNNSMLKSSIKKIIENETDAPYGGKVYSCDKNYDFNKMTAEYIEELEAKAELSGKD